MVRGGGKVVPPDGEQDLVAELARVTVQQFAPEELPLFEETAADYFRDPERLLTGRHRDDALGFGLEIALVTPYVLAVSTEVVRFLASVVAEAVRDEIAGDLKPVIAGPIRRLLRRDTPLPADRSDEAGHAPAPAPGLTSEQAREVRRVALQRATQCGLTDDRASLLADAVVGAFLVNG